MEDSTKYISSAIMVVSVIGVLFIAFMQLSSAPVQLPVQQIATSTLVATTTSPAILEIKMGNVLNASGTIDSAINEFGRTDNIYAVLSLDNFFARTPISYIRTFNGKYIDSKVSHVTEDGIKSFHFNWILSPEKSRNVGDYSLSFYIDGVKAKTVDYTVK